MNVRPSPVAASQGTPRIAVGGLHRGDSYVVPVVAVVETKYLSVPEDSYRVGKAMALLPGIPSEAVNIDDRVVLASGEFSGSASDVNPRQVQGGGRRCIPISTQVNRRVITAVIPRVIPVSSPGFLAVNSHHMARRANRS